MAFAGAPLILTTRATASGLPRRAPGERIGLGFIGMGIQNRFHLRAFLDHPDAQVLAVCDVDTTRREHCVAAANEKYGNSDCKGYLDSRELLARPDIDAVVIATPDHWHAIQVIEAAKAGKDIYCEKPLCFTLAEAKAMVDAVRKHERVFQTGSQQRTEFGGRFRTACELVRNGRVGEIVSVSVGIHAYKGSPTSKPCDLPEEPMEPGLDWDRWLGPAPKRPYNSILSPRGVHNFYPDWRMYREYSGGMITDWGAHMFDIAQWGLDMDALGPVEALPPRKEGAQFGARLVYGSGIEATHEGPTGVMFTGTRGWLFVSREEIRASHDSIVNEPLGGDAPRLPAPANHRQDWIDCIRTRSKPVCDVEVGARSFACCALTNLAYWHRQAVRWNPATWELEGDGTVRSWADYTRRAGFELPRA